jgi:putative ABC transport system substrate-binding protein
MSVLGVAAATWPFAARAQQRAVPVLGFLGAESAATNEHFVDAFRQGMRELGYIDGQNFILESRWAEGRSERSLHLSMNFSA